MIRPSAAIAALVLDARDDTIAVQRFLDVRRARCTDRARRRRRARRSRSPRGVHLQPADDDVHPVREAEAVAADLEQLAVGDERLQQPPERRAVLARHLEQLDQLARARRMVRALAQAIQDLVA